MAKISTFYSQLAYISLSECMYYRKYYTGLDYLLIWKFLSSVFTTKSILMTARAFMYGIISRCVYERTRCTVILNSACCYINTSKGNLKYSTHDKLNALYVAGTVCKSTWMTVQLSMTSSC